MASICSFGYKHANKPKIFDGSTAILDVRALRNPYAVYRLRSLDGTHPEVQAYVESDPSFAEIVEEAKGLLKAGHKRIAFGCSYGHHRSVAVVELFTRIMKKQGVKGLTNLHYHIHERK